MSVPAPDHWAMLTEEAMLALWANRLRSALTMLGVVIGVASLILMLAIEEGSQRGGAASTASLGSDQVIVLSGSAPRGEVCTAAFSLLTLTSDDAAAVCALPGVNTMAPVSQFRAQVVIAEKDKATSVMERTLAYFAINNMVLFEGTALSEADSWTGSYVTVIGQTVDKALFEGQSAVGQGIRIERQVFEVIGLLRPKGQDSGRQDQDDVIVLPISTAQCKLSGKPSSGSVGASELESANAEQKVCTTEKITLLLRQRPQSATGNEDDLVVRDLSPLTERLGLKVTNLSALLGSIAFISLLIGGISIMNNMLVSVTERTREIGLRMVLGARRSSVLGQFLIEAALLSVFGALIGLALAVGAGWLFGRTGAFSPVYSLSSIGLSLGLAAIVGVVFGWWPARRASQLEPIEALHYQ